MARRVAAPRCWASATPGIPDRKGTWSTSSTSVMRGRRSRRPPSTRPGRPRAPSRPSMAERLRRVAVLTGIAKEATAAALRELAAARARLGVELLMPADEAARHDDLRRRSATRSSTRTPCAPPTSASCSAATARSCARSGVFSAAPCPRSGVNYGNVGFLAALARDDWAGGLAAILDGEHRVIELLTVDVQVNGQQLHGRQRRHPQPGGSAARAAARVRGRRGHRGQHVLRRAHHRLAHRVHRLQPLVRRTDRRVERRGAGAQLHRPAFAGLPARSSCGQTT